MQGAFESPYSSDLREETDHLLHQMLAGQSGRAVSEDVDKDGRWISDSVTISDILDQVMMDVRKNESTLLEENASLKSQVKMLMHWKEKFQSKASHIEAKRVKAQQLQAKLAEKERNLIKREQACSELESKLQHRRATASSNTSGLLLLKKAKNEKKNNATSNSSDQVSTESTSQICSAFLDYMSKCEGLFEKSGRAKKIRKSLTEKSPSNEICTASMQHFSAIERAREADADSFRGKLREIQSQAEERHSGESKSANMNAALRIREKKAQREKNELLQTLSTVHTLCNKVLSSTETSFPDLEALSQLCDATKERFSQ